MKPAPFRYLAPRDEAELVSALQEHGGDARLLAGGQSLVPMMNFRVVTPSVLIDINRVKTLSFVEPRSEAVEIGALTRHAMLEDSKDIAERMPLLAAAMGQVAHRAVRNRGTMGGSLALAYPAAELPMLFVTLGAELRLRSPRGERRVSANEFIVGPLDTVLADDEFIHSARLPALPERAGSAFIEVSRRHGDFALAAAAAVVDLDASGRVQHVRAGLSGGTGSPVRLSEVERALMGQAPTKRLLEDIALTVVDSIEVEGDRQYPAGYRRLLLSTVLQRALDTAAARAEAHHVH
jgi:CO/xanthine dehydrogenase FAD-binding subunit